MIAHQVSVFLENKPGRLEKITAVLKEQQLNIRAMTLSTDRKRPAKSLRQRGTRRYCGRSWW